FEGADPAAAPVPPAAAAPGNLPAGRPGEVEKLAGQEALESFLRQPGAAAGQGLPAADNAKGSARRMVEPRVTPNGDVAKGGEGLMKREFQPTTDKEQGAGLAPRSGTDALASGDASGGTLRAKTGIDRRGAASGKGVGALDENAQLGAAPLEGRRGGALGGFGGGQGGPGGGRFGFGAPPAGESRDKGEGAERLKEAMRMTAPPSLYFDPQLVTDANGRVTIVFTMPEGETEYRLLVDALGKGRIGSKQQTIVGTKDAK
ncbi:MAG TPA: hypothetical protein VFB96_14660, partial [Pirellulaceae bacterium]|nr:hypothetical protein [Pirellulaceae bacterium]